MNRLAQLDHRYSWHPFTQMRDWLASEPLVIVRAQGAWLQDAYGRKYLDANSSIWTNLHGHGHRKINAAIQRQLKKISHSSALGLSNEPSSLLAEKLVKSALPCSFNSKHLSATKARPPLLKAFFSDDGSTAMEVAFKLGYEFARRTGRSKRPRFVSLQQGYHGDTVGAVALGHIDLFHKAYSGLLYKTDSVMTPYCYRCRFNRAKPDRADARDYRKCNWECLDTFEQKFARQKKRNKPYSAFVFEPLIQGAAGMIPQPRGWLGRACQIAQAHGALLIADEIMTAFGRTGSLTINPSHEQSDRRHLPIFACQHEGVQPDFLAVAKGLTGGYLPMAATLVTQEIFDAFLGEYAEFKTFFHGHSFTGNQLGAAASLASLKLLESSPSRRDRLRLEQALRNELKGLWALGRVGDIRQVGLVAGIELVKDWRTREPFDLSERAGIRVCEAMVKRGVITRPIGNVIVVMPPYCTTPKEVTQIIAAFRDAVSQELGDLPI